MNWQAHALHFAGLRQRMRAHHRTGKPAGFSGFSFRQWRRPCKSAGGSGRGKAAETLPPERTIGIRMLATTS